MWFRLLASKHSGHDVLVVFSLRSQVRELGVVGSKPASSAHWSVLSAGPRESHGSDPRPHIPSRALPVGVIDLAAVFVAASTNGLRAAFRQKTLAVTGEEFNLVICRLIGHELLRVGQRGEGFGLFLVAHKCFSFLGGRDHLISLAAQRWVIRGKVARISVEGKKGEGDVGCGKRNTKY